MWYILGRPSGSDVQLMMLAKLAVNNLIGLLKCDQQMVRPVTLKVLPFAGLFSSMRANRIRESSIRHAELLNSDGETLS